MRMHLVEFVVLAAAHYAVAGELKEWHDPAGKVIANAEFIGMEGDQLQIKKADGRVVTLAMTRLSADDQFALLPNFLHEVDRPCDPARASVDEVIEAAKSRQARDAKL